MNIHSLLKNLILSIPSYIEYIKIRNNQLTIYVNKNHLVKVIFFLKNHTNTQFKGLVDISCIDFPHRKDRFEIFYLLLSHALNLRICVKVISDEFSKIDSITGLFESANWFEREVWDMFGVCFANHPDLRRILTDYGFEGHPLRKDFPLTGYTELRYDVEKKRVVQEGLELAQEYRNFDFKNPWNKLTK